MLYIHCVYQRKSDDIYQGCMLVLTREAAVGQSVNFRSKDPSIDRYVPNPFPRADKRI